MRSTALAGLFFALFALFFSGLLCRSTVYTDNLSDLFLAAVANAAPAVEGAISKRQCLGYWCRFEVNMGWHLASQRLPDGQRTL
jgi:hypothetical protein